MPAAINRSAVIAELRAYLADLQGDPWATPNTQSVAKAIEEKLDELIRQHSHSSQPSLGLRNALQ